MDLQPSPEHDLIRQTVREFSERRLRPPAKHIDAEHWWPATGSPVEPLACLRQAAGGRCPPALSPRTGAFGPRDPLTARAAALAGVA